MTLLPGASYQIRKIAGCACAGNARNAAPRYRLQRKPLVNDHGMHHGTCVTHVPWYMSGSLTRGGSGGGGSGGGGVVVVVVVVVMVVVVVGGGVRSWYSRRMRNPQM